MKQKNTLIKDLKAILKKELKKNVQTKNKIYDFESWDSLANFNILLSCEKKFNLWSQKHDFSDLSKDFDLQKKRITKSL